MRQGLVCLIVCLAASGCTARFNAEWSDGKPVEFITFSNLWSPNVTLVRGDLSGETPGEEILVYQGASSMNQAWTMGAGTAAAGYFIGSGIEDAEPDQTNVSQEGGGANASAEGGNASSKSSAKSFSKSSTSAKSKSKSKSKSSKY